MQRLFLVPLFVLPLFAPRASAQISGDPGGGAFDAEPVRIVFGGQGGGTLVMPGIFNGHVRAQLQDEANGVALQLEAELIPYSFLVAHNPAGAISGVLTTVPHPESEDEPVELARLEGEWAVDSDGIGSIAARFYVVPGRGLEPVVAGGLRGMFRVPPPVEFFEIAPPLYPHPPIPLANSRMLSRGSARAAAVAPQGASGAPGAPSAPDPIAGELESAGPTIIIDYIDPPYVTRARFSWALVL